MLAWTWLTWPDAIYDFGSQLYFPWQITQGKRLYVDIAYFNGPLSQYFNAAAFAIFGARLRTLVWLNLLILAATLALIYRLLDRLSGAITATVGCLVFVLVFAFGQYVGIGNYNWVCPYTHEVTHGVALSIGAIAALSRFVRTRGAIWLAVTGTCLGLTFLTKAEIFIPAAAAVSVGVWFAAVQPWRRTNAPLAPTPGSEVLRRPGSDGAAESGSSRVRSEPGVGEVETLHSPVGSIAILLAFAIVPVAITFVLLLIHLPATTVARAIAGSWPWLFDRRIASLQFYREGLGIDDVPGNLLRLVAGTTFYVAAAVAVVTAGRARGALRAIAILVVAAIAVLALVEWPLLVHAARPWPVLALAIGACALRSMRRQADHASIIRLVFAVFAFGLLGKMPLNARIAQYGFALAMPAAMLLVDAAVGWGPAWVASRGGSAAIARACALLPIAVVVVVHLYACHLFIADKTVVVGEGADRFLAGPPRGVEVEAARRAIQSGAVPADTLAVMPQGLMLNYLTRRPNPLPVPNLMPPELLTTGEDRVLAALAAHPPELIVLSLKDVGQRGFILTEGRYEYGERTLAWVKANYDIVGDLTPPGGAPAELRLRFLKRRAAGRSM